MNWKTIDFTITPAILQLFADVERLTGKVEGVNLSRATPRLRAKNRARSVWGSTGIEGSRSSIEQVEALMRGESVALSKKEQLEIKNALEAYHSLPAYLPYSFKSLLEAHATLMQGGLMLSAGHFRQSPVEVFITENKIRAMPSWQIIPDAIKKLFQDLEESIEPMLLKAVRFHFNFVNLHPFMDGNGRIARLWQTRLMMEAHPVFEFLDVESMIFEKRDKYYHQIRIGQETGDIGGFVIFMLEQVKRSLESLWDKSKSGIPSSEERLSIAAEVLAGKQFSRKEYTRLFKTVSAPTASRDLASGVSKGLLSRSGDRRTAVYLFILKG